MYCGRTKIKTLDNLPQELQELWCYGNDIKTLNNLPKSINKLYCNQCDLSRIDNLPTEIKFLYCIQNPLCLEFINTLQMIKTSNSEYEIKW